jgi:hypothetical protein
MRTGRRWSSALVPLRAIRRVASPGDPYGAIPPTSRTFGGPSTPSGADALSTAALRVVLTEQVCGGSALSRL